MSTRYATRRLTALASGRVVAASVSRGGAFGARRGWEAEAAGAGLRFRVDVRTGPWCGCGVARRGFAASGSVFDKAETGTGKPPPAADAKAASPKPKDADNPMAGIMFPWERAVLSGDRQGEPMSNMQKLYWVVFAGAVAFLVVNRVRLYYASLKTKEELAEELAENRRAMQAALEGKSFADADDPFEGMEPHEIEAFLKKQAPDGDPYAGMTPEEINDYLHKAQEAAVRENLSMPKRIPTPK